MRLQQRNRETLATKQRLPFLPAKIDVRKRNTEPRISDFIHEPQRLRCKKPIRAVVLNQNAASGNAASLLDKLVCVRRVMEDVDEHDDVNGVSWKWDMNAVILADRNARVMPQKDVNSSDRDIATLLQNGLSKQAVPTSNIEHRCVRRQQFSNSARECSYASLLYVSFV